MSIPSTVPPRNDHVGNGATATYVYGFRIYEATDLKVSIRDLAGAEVILTYLTDYTVTGVNSAQGGTIALVAGNLTNGFLLTIRFSGGTKQPIDLRNQGGLFPESIEDALDRIVRYLQKVEDVVMRSLHLQETEAGNDLKTTLPSSTDRASKFLAFDAQGNPIASSTVTLGVTASSYIQTLLDDANATTARATLGIDSEYTDAEFRLAGSSDVTKKLAFEVDGLTAGTTRTITPQDRNLTLGTVLVAPVTTTSGNTHDITGLPDGVRSITVMLNGVSTNGSSNLVIQIGDAGGVENTGYIGIASEIGGTAVPNTSYFPLTTVITAGTLVSGGVTLTLQNASTNTWVISGTIVEEGASVVVVGGKKSLSGVLDRVRLTMTAADSFDAGQFSLAYQF